MTEEDKNKPLSGKGSNDTDDDVIVERRSKKPRLHKELTLLGNNLGKAVKSMNEVSQAMLTMISEYKRKLEEFHASIKSMGLQGISNKGYLAALVAFQNELASVKWQLSGSGKAQVMPP